MPTPQTAHQEEPPIPNRGLGGRGDRHLVARPEGGCEDELHRADRDHPDLGGPGAVVEGDAGRARGSVGQRTGSWQVAHSGSVVPWFFAA